MAKSSFEVLIDDGGLDEAFKEVPFSVAFGYLKSTRRAMFQFEKEVSAKQKTPGMRFFVRKFMFIRSNPQPRGKAVGGGGLLNTTRRFLKAGGRLSDIWVEGAMFGPVHTIHEKGGTIVGKQIVPVPKGRFRRGLKRRLGKSGSRKRVTGNLLRQLSNERRGLSSNKKGAIVSFVGKKGMRHWFVVTKSASKGQKAELERIASEVKQVVIPPTTGINKFWKSDSVRIFEQHQTDMLLEIENGFRKKRKAKRRKT